MRFIPLKHSLSAMRVQMVVACGLDRAIGQSGTMPWYLPEDLKHFKQTTTRTCLIMGRKTFLSIGRALPQRRNIVVSSTLMQSNESIHASGIEVAPTLDAALELALSDGAPAAAGAEEEESCVYETISLIGGARIFASGLNIAHEVVVTEIGATFPQADTFFPELEKGQWQVLSSTPESGQYFLSQAAQPQDFVQCPAHVPLCPEAMLLQEQQSAQEQGLAYRFLRYRRCF